MTVKERIANEIEELFGEHVDITDELTLDQLGIIFEGFLYGLNTINIFSCCEYNYDQMNEILDGMRKGVDTSIYMKPEYNYLQMKIIKDTLADNLSVDCLISDNYTWDQMYQIRLGMLDNIDISYYANPELNVTDMIKIRKELLMGVA